MEERGEADLVKELKLEMHKCFKQRREEEEKKEEADNTDSPLKSTRKSTEKDESNSVSSSANRIVDSVDVVHMKVLRKIRLKFAPLNVYVHMCNKCHEIGQMLHAETCVLCD